VWAGGANSAGFDVGNERGRSWEKDRMGGWEVA